jgi:hypothetical protein
MKRIALALFLALLCSAAGAVTLQTGTNGKDISESNPLPVVGTMSAIMTSSGTLTVGLASETIGLKTAIQDTGSQTVLLKATAASITSGLATPTIQTVSLAGLASGTVVNISNRAFIVIQSKTATETIYVYPGLTATPGLGMALFPGSSIKRPWGSSVAVSYAASTAFTLVTDQEVLP